MKVQHIIGADLSKKTIDLFCHLHGSYMKIGNCLTGYKSLVKWMKEQKLNSSKTMIVMEHTGLYSYQFELFLHRHKINFCKVSGLAVKRSMGIVRGKSDKVDAERIAAYGYDKKDILTREAEQSHSMKRLKMLYSTRGRLLKQRVALMCAIKEYKHIGIAENDLMIKGQRKLLKAVNEQIRALMEEIEKVIKEDAILKQNYELLLTIRGVGKVVALITIIKTANFSRFSTARKFACYSGTAPFDYTSGTSIKKRTAISPLADKKMKSILDLAAKSAIQNDKELRQYFLKRTEAGKSKMSTINIVRNKLIFRMFAVIKRQTPFIENYVRKAA